MSMYAKEILDSQFKHVISKLKDGNNKTYKIIAEGAHSVILDTHKEIKYKVFFEYDRDNTTQKIKKIPKKISSSLLVNRIKELSNNNFDCIKSNEINSLKLTDSDNGEVVEASCLEIRWAEGFDSIRSIYKEEIINDFDLYNRLNILKTIALEMKEIHKKNIVHNDLNAGNILLNNENQIEIIDFLLYKKQNIVMRKDESWIPEWLSPSFLNSIATSLNGFDDKWNDIFSFIQLFRFMLVGSYHKITHFKADTATFTILNTNINDFGLVGKITNPNTIILINKLYSSVTTKNLDWDEIIGKIIDIQESCDLSKQKARLSDFENLKEHIRNNHNNELIMNQLIHAFEENVFDDLSSSRSMIEIERLISPSPSFFKKYSEISFNNNKIYLLNICKFPIGKRRVDCTKLSNDNKVFLESGLEHISFKFKYLFIDGFCYEFENVENIGPQDYQIKEGNESKIDRMTITKKEEENVFTMKMDKITKTLTPNEKNFFNKDGKFILPDDNTELHIFQFNNGNSINLTDKEIYFRLDDEKKVLDSRIISLDNQGVVSLIMKRNFLALHEMKRKLIIECKVNYSMNGEAKECSLKISNIIVEKPSIGTVLAIDIANTANIVAFSKEFSERETDLLEINELNKKNFPGSPDSDFIESDKFYLSSLLSLSKETMDMKMGIPKSYYSNLSKFVVLPSFKLIIGEDLEVFRKKNGVPTRVNDLDNMGIEEIVNNAMNYFFNLIIDVLVNKFIERLEVYAAVLDDPKCFLHIAEFINTVIISTPIDFGDNKINLIRERVKKITYNDILKKIIVNEHNKYSLMNIDFINQYQIDNVKYNNVKNIDDIKKLANEIFSEELKNIEKEKCFGDDNIMFLSEPEAILNKYLNDIPFEDYPDNILVYDLGGGTLDCMILSKKENTNRYELIKQYSNYFGGDILDVLFVEWILNEDDLIDYLYKTDNYDENIFAIVELIFNFKSKYKINGKEFNELIKEDLGNSSNMSWLKVHEKIKVNLNWENFISTKGEEYFELISETVFRHLSFKLEAEYFKGKIKNPVFENLEKESVVNGLISYSYRKKEKESVVKGSISYSNRNDMIKPHIINKEPIHQDYELGFIIKDSNGNNQFRRNNSTSSVEIRRNNTYAKKVMSYQNWSPGAEGGIIEESMYNQIGKHKIANLIEKSGDGKAATTCNISFEGCITENDKIKKTMYHKYYHKLTYTMFLRSLNEDREN